MAKQFLWINYVHSTFKVVLFALFMLLEFFPFGIGSGDTVGPREIDATSNVIHLDIPIIFYQKEETDLYVSL